MCTRRPLTSSTNRDRTPDGKADDGRGASSLMTLSDVACRGRLRERDASLANPARQANLDGRAGFWNPGTMSVDGGHEGARSGRPGLSRGVAISDDRDRLRGVFRAIAVKTSDEKLPSVQKLPHNLAHPSMFHWFFSRWTHLDISGEEEDSSVRTAVSSRPRTSGPHRLAQYRHLPRLWKLLGRRCRYQIDASGEALAQQSVVGSLHPHALLDVIQRGRPSLVADLGAVGQLERFLPVSSRRNLDRSCCRIDLLHRTLDGSIAWRWRHLHIRPRQLRLRSPGAHDHGEQRSNHRQEPEIIPHTLTSFPFGADRRQLADTTCGKGKRRATRCANPSRQRLSRPYALAV